MVIRLGYEIGTGDAVNIPLRHTAVTGQTQESGKTTTLEAVIARSGLRAVAFITKRGEKSFRLETPIAPYFREPALDAETPMWRWVESIFGTLGESVGSDDQALIIQCSRYPLRSEDYKQKGEPRTRVVESRREPVKTLAQVAANVALMLQHARGRDRKSLTRLDAYFQIVMPQIARMKSSGSLDLAEGINVMDLEGLTSEMQMLIVRSVLEMVYSERRNTVVIIPEAWKFIPRARTSPVRFAAEIYIRQGLALKNVLMLDSQDLANIATEVLKSIGVWILGKQSEINEVKRVVDYIPAVPRIPREAIMQLGKGEFYVVAEGKVKKCYVQPFGMEDLHAQAIARGEESADSWGGIERTLDKAERKREGQDAEEAKEEARADIRAESAGLADERSAEARAGANPDRGGGGARDRDESEDEMSAEEKTELEHLRWHLRHNVPICSECPESLRNVILAESALEEARAGGNGLPASSGAVDVAYEQIRARLLADESVLVALDALRPEIRVQVDRPALDFDGSSIKGRLAILLTENYFKAPRRQADVLREFKRRGWLDRKTGNAVIIRPMAEITEMGLLTVEPEGYQAAPGMKVSKAEN
jgi:hypothetical protein